MSFRADHFLKFKGVQGSNQNQLFDTMSEDDIVSLFVELLNNGVHGLCFSLYEEGQKPGDTISEKQIRKRLEILQPYIGWIRSFSTTEGNEFIPKIAKEYGIKTLVGAWLGDDEVKNRKEIVNLLQLAEDNCVDIAAVGNEVLYRGDLPVDQLITIIEDVKNQIPGIPVGYVDAYYEFLVHPEITELCDVILSNCYPFWEGTHFDHSLLHFQHMYAQAKSAAKDKKVIVTETGWPSKGQTLGKAVPGEMNAMKYFINSQLWTLDEEIEMFYFSSFDESWKIASEGEVGAYWGLWDSKGKLKFIQ